MEGVKLASGILLAATSFATTQFATAAPAQSSFADALTQIDHITEQGHSLHGTSLAFATERNPASLSGALDLYNAAYALMAAVDHAKNIANVASPRPVSRSEAEMFYNRLDSLEPLLATIFQEFKVKKLALLDLEHIPGFRTALGHPHDVVRAALLTSKQKMFDFRDAVIGACPPEFEPQARVLAQKYETLYTDAIATYS